LLVCDIIDLPLIFFFSAVAKGLKTGVLALDSGCVFAKPANDLAVQLVSFWSFVAS